MEEKRIRGKVAKILNSRELVINIGSKEGVLVGMYFEVLDQKCENIKDPDTGDILGSIERPKVRVKVIEVQEQLSIASTYRRKQLNQVSVIGESAFPLSFSEFFKPKPKKLIMEYETLKTTEKTWEDLDESQSYVKVGDPVKQVLEDIYDEEKQTS